MHEITEHVMILAGMWAALLIHTSSMFPMLYFPPCFLGSVLRVHAQRRIYP